MNAAAAAKYLDEHLYHLDNLEIYSIFNCLNEQDIEDMYFLQNYKELTRLYVQKYLNDYPGKFRRIIADMIQEFEYLDVNERRKIRESLCKVAAVIEDKMKHKLFKILVLFRNVC